MEHHLVGSGRLGNGGGEAAGSRGNILFAGLFIAEEGLDGRGDRPLEGSQHAGILLGDHDQPEDERRNNQQRNDHRDQAASRALFLLRRHILVGNALAFRRTDATGRIHIGAADTGLLRRAKLLEGRIPLRIHRAADDGRIRVFLAFPLGGLAGQRGRTRHALGGNARLGACFRHGLVLPRAAHLLLHRRGDLGRLGDAFFLNRILRGQHILFVNQTGKAFRAAAAGRVSFLRYAHGRNRAGRLVLILEQIHTVFCSFTQMPQENFRCGPYSLHAGHTLL